MIKNNYCKASGHSTDHDKTRSVIVPTTFLLNIMTVENMWRMKQPSISHILILLSIQKISSNDSKHLKFCCCESRVSQEMTNFGNYPGDFSL